MLFALLVILFVIVCIFLCLLILIQSDKGGGISGAIGGGLGGANSLLGTQDTANILTRGTTIFGTVFFLLCIAMSFVMSKQNISVNKSMLQERAEKQKNFSPSSVLGNTSLPIQEGAQEAPAAAGTATEGQGVLPIMPSADEEKADK
ncbi:MAG: preprotein translocase subunit SecG [Chitinispirillaceae bacterium]|nr:preprotein translocase subunit SecG [Chitinispirillaceae bacterium]